MEKTLVALFDNGDDAQQAVRDLIDNNFDRVNISLVTAHQQAEPGGAAEEELSTGSTVPSEKPSPDVVHPDTVDMEAKAGAGIGAILGGVGGILVGLGALAIPGIGPVLAAGPLAAALGGVAGAGGGAIAGGAAGGLVGALTEMGLPKESAGAFAEGVRRGGTLVTMRVSDIRADDAKHVLDRHHPVDVNERVSHWREAGWSGFSPTDRQPTGQSDTMTTGEVGPEVMEDRDAGVTEDRVITSDLTQASTGIQSPDFDQVSPFDTFESHFRTHYVDNFSDRGYGYNKFLPAYRYGYDLANNEAYTDLDWDQIEPHAQDYWDERHPGTWPDFRDAVYYAWSQVRQSKK